MPMLEQTAIWATILGTLASFAAIAWSAVTYVQIRRAETKHQEYLKFFAVCDQLGQQGGSIVSKVAAAFELRKYPQYKDVILRLIDDVRIEGDAAKMLRKELELTAEFLRRQ
jgi:hypothetical protein